MAPFPDRAGILDRLKAVVREKIDVEPERLRPDAKLADIGIDSFALIELVFIAEEEFKIKIPVEGLRVITVNDVLGVIERCGGAAKL